MNNQYRKIYSLKNSHETEKVHLSPLMTLGHEARWAYSTDPKPTWQCYCQHSLSRSRHPTVCDREANEKWITHTHTHTHSPVPACSSCSLRPKDPTWTVPSSHVQLPANLQHTYARDFQQRQQTLTYTYTSAGNTARWLGCRCLASRLSQTCARSNLAFHPSRVGKWAVIHVITWNMGVETTKWQARATYGCMAAGQSQWARVWVEA